MTIAPEVAKRFSGAERRLKEIESVIGSGAAVVNELSDFSRRSDWIPGDSLKADHVEPSLLWTPD